LSHLGEPQQKQQGRDVRHSVPHTQAHGDSRNDRAAALEKAEGHNGSTEDGHFEDAQQQAKPHGAVALAWDF